MLPSLSSERPDRRRHGQLVPGCARLGVVTGDDAPLEGYRVVELGVWVAGPAAGGVLSDWGADVIKVEPPSGDPMRQVFALSAGATETRNPPFDLDNRGKRSVVIDLRDPDGRDTLERLLATADVLLTNLRVDALERLGLAHTDVLERHPRLVYASVTGFGLDGPDRNRAGYDVGAFYARTGLASTMTMGDEPPPALRSGKGDHVTGLAAVGAVLAALLRRERTGRGGLVETSLLRAGMYVTGWELAIQQRFGKAAAPEDRAVASTPLVNCYRSKDGRWFWLLGLEADRHLPGLLRAIDREDLADDERFTTARDRRLNAGAFITELDAAFAQHTRDEWADVFAAHDVWRAPVQSLAEAVADPQARSAGAIVTMAGGDESIAAPAGFGERDVVARPVPALGEHTAEVLGELAPPALGGGAPPAHLA
ncbi:MAG: CoA transferase [Actinomycetota bacterium]|nr:CoA transferase [Actinomycetota bacterium]